MLLLMPNLKLLISIHASAKEATYYESQFETTTTISIHASAKEATGVRHVVLLSR